MDLRHAKAVRQLLKSASSGVLDKFSSVYLNAATQQGLLRHVVDIVIGTYKVFCCVYETLQSRFKDHSKKIRNIEHDIILMKLARSVLGGVIEAGEQKSWSKTTIWYWRTSPIDIVLFERLNLQVVGTEHPSYSDCLLSATAFAHRL